ncbi:MAG TPA: TylF/MycF/NovP-related O-methyltransferase [Casimicrobiaceae bacterium]|nr:TylF/MycF/NovP-related O-methyltransferase [Casimicrobiaceae bacterium]
MSNADALRDQYIELLKRSLLDDLYIENEARIVLMLHSLVNGIPIEPGHLSGIVREAHLMDLLRKTKEDGSTFRMKRKLPDGSWAPLPEMRNFTELSHTMIGRRRLDNLQTCVATVLREGVPGDLIETGIWRGGACIFMRGLLLAHHVEDRTVWCADSFDGVPAPSHPADAGFDLSKASLPVLAVSLEEVKALFERYGLLDERVQFLKGWFKDTLPSAPIEKLAVLRLDGDLYESTMDALQPLYDKVSHGGFVVVDDYHSCPPCGQAVEEFRASRGIATPLQRIDEQAVYWRKD